MLSSSGVQFIKGLESFRATPYRDGDKWAIGYGHNYGAGERVPAQVTESQATAILLTDAAIAEGAIARCVKVPLTQPQLDALISLVFNWGEGNFCSSELLKRLNAGDYAGAAARLREYPITQKGVVQQGLVTRRNLEADLFLSGTQDGGGSPIIIPDGGNGDLLKSLFDDSGLGDDGPSIKLLAIIAVIIAGVYVFSR